MVTAEHESPIKIIRDHPEVIVQLLEVAFDIKVSADATIRSASEACTQLAPTAYTADNVVEIYEGASTEPTLSVVAETQRGVDARKHRSWPLYVAEQFAKTLRPCYLVVISPRRSVADWARQPIKLGHPGFDLTPLVVGPGTGPLITSTHQAARMPEMTVLSALANVTPHTREFKEITHAALATIDNQNEKSGELYTDMVMAVLSNAAKQILEEYVTTGTADYKFKSEPFLRHRAEGRAEGKAEGRAEGEAEALLVILENRGVGVSGAARERILACRDESVLREWLRRALTATSVDELFR
ncbi:hypothetical protein SAMN05443665_102380 [Actinomadura meyerae]|uniref:Transposase, YhgA-like n=1 Tax=Actinomadura meyerae TaxID=240840 RepID=A0A239LQ79_9ACTN|nr:hypothetical protein [Actinomadura meyerae]SNT31794.1 hypothetical protein SAMN05443665_102380 [Actinomadura meyerae]